MASSNADIIIGVNPDLLKAAGYTFYKGDDRHWWFTWAAPGMADCETGETCATMEAAYEDALAHWFSNACIPQHVLDEDGDDEALSVPLAVPLLQRCEAFLVGFEDDPDQTGIPELLADIRATLADAPTPSPVKLETLARDATQVALDAGCKYVQDALGITTGDTAGVFWTGGETESLQNAFDSYVYAEQEALKAEAWSLEYSAAAKAEGWMLCEGYEIRHDDEAGPLLSDAEAVTHVRERAAEGSTMHIEALRICMLD